MKSLLTTTALALVLSFSPSSNIEKSLKSKERFIVSKVKDDWARQYAFYSSEYIGHQQEDTCPGAQYLRINANDKMEECVHFITGGWAWVELPTESDGSQIIETLSFFPSPDKTDDMNAFCECFINLDPTESMKRLY